MAADWPTVDDVKAMLRVDDTTDDTFIGQCLAAAVLWVQNRVDPAYIPPANATVPAALFWVATAEAARLVRRRDSVDGTIGWGDMGVVRVGPKDPDIETMIARYLAVVFA